MNSRTSARFRSCFSSLPAHIQKQARDSYRLFKNNPQHPSLRFKPVHPSRPIYSVRVNQSYRALGVRTGDEIVWFWIGDHDEYERLLAKG